VLTEAETLIQSEKEMLERLSERKELMSVKELAKGIHYTEPMVTGALAHSPDPLTPLLCSSYLSPMLLFLLFPSFSETGTCPMTALSMACVCFFSFSFGLILQAGRPPPTSATCLCPRWTRSARPGTSSSKAMMCPRPSRASKTSGSPSPCCGCSSRRALLCPTPIQVSASAHFHLGR